MSYEFRCKCGNSVSLELRPTVRPTCQRHTKATSRLMDPVFDDWKDGWYRKPVRERRTEEVRARHAVSVTCGYCRTVMQEGCFNDNPCDECLRRGPGPKVVVAYSTCDDCNAKRPWLDIIRPPATLSPKAASWTEVDSKSISAIRFTQVQFASGKKATTGNLDVRFKSGAEYRHSTVPEDVYGALVLSSSIGKFYNANIRTQYPAVPLSLVEEVSADEPVTKSRSPRATRNESASRAKRETRAKPAAKKAAKKTSRKTSGKTRSEPASRKSSKARASSTSQVSRGTRGQRATKKVAKKTMKRTAKK